MLKRICLLIILLNILWSPVGHAEESKGGRWIQLKQADNAEVYLDKIRFTSNLVKGNYPELYKADIWIKFISTKQDIITVIEKWQIEIDTRTYASRYRVLQGESWKNGEYTKSYPQTEWKETTPGTRRETICMDVLIYDMEGKKDKPTNDQALTK